MNRPELFNKTISILVKAYFGGTLEAGDCGRCAVGNLVSAQTGEVAPHNWFRHIGRGAGPDGEDRRELAGSKQLDAIGYTITQVIKIEGAFESGHVLDHGERGSAEAQFGGLMAVVDVLQHIHGCDQAETEAARELFLAHA